MIIVEEGRGKETVEEGRGKETVEEGRGKEIKSNFPSMTFSSEGKEYSLDDFMSRRWSLSLKRASV